MEEASSSVIDNLFPNSFKDDEESEDLPPPPPAREVKKNEAFGFEPFPTEDVEFDKGFRILKGTIIPNPPHSSSESDLVPGKYEGGMKLWEGTIDLINAVRTEVQDGHLVFRRKDVLELGCGHGLPGIVAILKGAKKIHFQDFNEEVLINLTIPNVQANLRIRQQHPPNSPVSPPPHPETRFFSGDWDDVASVLKMISPSNSQHVEHTEKREEPGGRRRRAVSFATEDEGLNSNPAQHKLLLGTPSFCIRGNTTEEGGGLYDVILTSETVYSRRSMVKLLNIMKKCIRKPYGVVYLAGKKHYFGVGGGTQQFKALVEEDGFFDSHLLAEHVDGSSNVREVWKFFIPA